MKTRWNILGLATALIAWVSIFLGGDVMAQGKVYGVVRDTKGEVVAGASVYLMRDGVPVNGATTTAEGRYDIYNVDAGTYTIEIKSPEGDITSYDTELTVSGTYVPQDLVMGSYEIDGGSPIMDKKVFNVDPIDPKGFDRGQIEDMPFRNPKDIIAVAGDVYQPDQGRELYVSGGRSSGTITFVDGIKMIGTEALPQATIEQVMLLSGGVPSEYGDVNGGVITITTRNPGMKGYFGTPRSLINIPEKKHKAKEKGQPGSYLFDESDIDSYAFNL